MEADKDESIGGSHVPPQKIGSEMNAVEEIALDTETEAIIFFKIVKKRLLDINSWSKIAGDGLSEFQLTDAAGHLVQRDAQQGDHIRINIPGPGTQVGAGYDWVLIEEIILENQHNQELLTMRARPSDNPLSQQQDTAHFLTNKATSTFQVRRAGRTIYAEEHARNEVPNAETENTFDNIRNTFVGWGSKIGFSYPQWKALVIGLLKYDEEAK